MVSDCCSKRCHERRLVIACWFVAVLGLLGGGLFVARAGVAGARLGRCKGMTVDGLGWGVAA